jgi:hypothetical protein
MLYAIIRSLTHWIKYLGEVKITDNNIILSNFSATVIDFIFFWNLGLFIIYQSDLRERIINANKRLT